MSGTTPGGEPSVCAALVSGVVHICVRVCVILVVATRARHARRHAGTKIVYRRDELVKLSQSPFARDKPNNFPAIPGASFS